MFTCSGRKKCKTYQQVFTMYSNVLEIHLCQSVSSLFNMVDNSDEGLEADLCTMLPTVHGTKQFCFIRQFN